MTTYDAVALAPLPTMHAIGISRPQVGIERLPTRRLSNEPRESMNCKSCRKRKIKCNRLRPACEACTVFQCPCIYDAVPKKRGPKTDVLEALLKRVDGLEAQLKEKKTEPQSPVSPAGTNEEEPNTFKANPESASQATLPPVNTSLPADVPEPARFSPIAREPSPNVQDEAMLDLYFARFHAKPYHILDESTLRQRLQLSQVPAYLIHSIFAVAARHMHHPNGYQAAVKLSDDYAARARNEIDIDEPSVDALQALLLLVTSFTASGRGKKAYMLFANAIGMAMALELHREMDPIARVTPVEREMRRRLFWTCYTLDRFMVCGSRRPSLIGDKTILLRLPSWSPNHSTMLVEGEFFQSGSNLQHLQGAGKSSQGSSGMLIDISRILGVTNRYLAAGGVKGDSHFPWHSLSNLSKIRQDLDVWASGTDDVFSSVDTLFGQPDSTKLVLSKLIYHLIHCLIYRPFLPIDLSELAGTGQHQSWQIEATNMCFMHANAIAELVELGKQADNIEWLAFVGYCLATAGTVHIHGVHYRSVVEPNAFSSSADFLAREMRQLDELRFTWAGVQQQQETLQAIYAAHSELVKSLANNTTRFPPVFHLEDFFDRYSSVGGLGGTAFSLDAASLSLTDAGTDFAADTIVVKDVYGDAGLTATLGHGGDRPMKRRMTGSAARRRSEVRNLQPIMSNIGHMQNPGLLTPSNASHMNYHTSFTPQPSPGMLHTPVSLPPHQEVHEQSSRMEGLADGSSDSTAVMAAAAAAGFTLAQAPPTQPRAGSLSSGPYSPPHYTFSQAANAAVAGSSQQQQTAGRLHPPHEFDPMFGGVPTNAFSSPAPWQGDDGTAKSGMAMAPSPGAGSHNGSAGTADEKDPFLSLLEQLAENESARGGSELDFFTARTPGLIRADN